MTKPLQGILKDAENVCAKTGGRLTDKRRRILELLLTSNVPMSAYALADVYNNTAEAPMPAMSVYRILDFLESEQLVHKLNSTNKFVACSQIGNVHKTPQFLICSNCKSVKEVAISQRLVSELGEQVSQTGYKLMDSPLELQCVCDNCSQSGLDAGQ